MLGFFDFGLRVSGEPARLLPELDLMLILACVEVVRKFWANSALRVPLALLIVAAFSPAIRYVRHAWFPFPKAPALENVYEYKITKWVHDQLPGARVLPSGTVRFWFDAWFDNAQPDGGSDQAILNQTIPLATWQIFQGDRADLSVLWLQALGTDAIVATEKNSFEPYHEVTHPEQFRGVLPVLYDDRHGSVIYGIPRVHPGIARVVDRAAIGAVGKIQGIDDKAGLTKYVSLIEDSARPAATLTWHGFDQANIDAIPGPGQSVLVQETWDPAWHAYENGKALPIRSENTMGFMLIDAPEGDHHIEMRFETPLENRAGQVLFVLTAIVLVGLVLRSFYPPARR